MGQTLTHGVYLPDEGERNCYAGLAANWQILDGSVGTIAAHTAALAGKAPLVHTHTVSQITDFPAYGNAAGTICEGNDSRLSDARTPVAHTHTKSDVTDLLNSDFIPSANNSYNLGSSSYQWNNLYAKNYYYNGTEFQNKFVTLDSVQAITGEKIFSSTISSKNYNYSRGTIPSTSQYNNFAFRDKSNNTTARLLRWFNADGYNGLALQSWDAQLTTDASVFFQLQYDSSGNGQAILGGNNFKEFDPLTNNSVDLGTSSRKWKTLNGINPGALSLPDYSKSMNVDTTGWSTSAGRINYTPTVNGWLQIVIPNDIDNNNEKSNFITIMDTDVPNVGFNNPSGLSAGNSNDYRIQITFPVVANKTYYIYIKSYSGNINAVKYIPALGHI